MTVPERQPRGALPDLLAGTLDRTTAGWDFPATSVRKGIPAGKREGNAKNPNSGKVVEVELRWLIEEMTHHVANGSANKYAKQFSFI